MISIASRLFSVAKVIKPDMELVSTAIFPEFKNLVVGSTMFDVPRRSFRIHWFADGSMLWFIDGITPPFVISDFIEIRDHVARFPKEIDPVMFSQAVSKIVSSLIFAEMQYPAHKAQQVIADACSWNTTYPNVGDH